MSAREPPDVWLPTTGQIVMASERAILATLDTALLLAARTLAASRSSSSRPACANSSPATAPRPTTCSATADRSSSASPLQLGHGDDAKAPTLFLRLASSGFLGLSGSSNRAGYCSCSCCTASCSSSAGPRRTT